MFTAKWRSYWRLMRFDKPIGILLLWYPVAWALWMATSGHPPLSLFFIFLSGTLIMRAAGCVINDIADRHIDRHVRRTKARPLTAGEIRLSEAISCFAALISLAFLLLLLLPVACIKWAIAALLITIIYPFTKRFLSAPQLVLGAAFSMAIPMVYTAAGIPLNINTWLLVLINLGWVLAYDTEYAMVDREDDLRIGVRSTAIWFGKADVLIISLLLVKVQLVWVLLARMNDFGFGFYLFWTLGTLIFLWEFYLIYHREPSACFKSFLWNAFYGLSLWAGLFFM